MTTTEPLAKIKRKGFFLLPFALYGLLLVNGRYGYLSTVATPLNYLIVLFAQALPWMGIRLLTRISYRRIRFLGTVLAFPFLFLSVLFVFLTPPGYLLFGANPKGFVLQRPLTEFSPPVRIYRRNPGGFGSMSIVIQQGYTPFPGLVWTRHLTGMSPADRVETTVLDPHHLRCIYPPYSSDSRSKPFTEIVTVP